MVLLEFGYSDARVAISQSTILLSYHVVSVLCKPCVAISPLHAQVNANMRLLKSLVFFRCCMVLKEYLQATVQHTGIGARIHRALDCMSFVRHSSLSFLVTPIPFFFEITFIYLFFFLGTLYLLLVKRTYLSTRKKG